MDGISPRRAFELRELGHELLALALRGGILEGDEAGRVGDSERLHLGGRRDAVLDALPDGRSTLVPTAWVAASTVAICACALPARPLPPPG
jgi:hypothetical protein